MTPLAALLDEGRRDEARALATQRLSTNPKDGEAAIALAKLELEAGNAEAAQRLLAGLSVQHAAQYDAMLVQATLAISQGRAKAAILTLAELAAREPKRPEAHYALAVAYMDGQQLELAEKSLRLAVEHAPNAAVFQLTLGEVLAGLGKAGDAAKAFAEATRLDPTLELPYVGLAVLLEALDRTDEAVALFNQAQKVLPASESLRRARAALESGEMRLRTAKDQLQTRAFEAAEAGCASLERRGLKGAEVVELRAAIAHARTLPPPRNTSASTPALSAISATSLRPTRG